MIAPVYHRSGGESTRRFCPIYLPADEYWERTTAYCAQALKAVQPRPEGALIHVPWHGQHVMAERMDEFAARLGVRQARLIPDIVVEGAFGLQEDEYRDSPCAALAREGVERHIFQHAGFFDYCVAEALGHLDRAKLVALRHEMETDLDAALRRHPAVHNLTGYLRYGGPEMDGLRRALGLAEGAPLPPVEIKWQDSCAIVGQAIVRRTIALAVQAILDMEQTLFGP